ncbi:MAG: diaminopropionate ammonia-lyase [Desulfocapsa sp.]|nr:diaminopropionate ammonia-lyase [Desulfocapsa sp.]MBN4045890.1 diaminopropionate ammonia-lyase [bacterium AH-315-P11]
MSIDYIFNKNLKEPGEGANLNILTTEEAEKARAYHKSFKEYEPTPLVSLPNLAEYLGIDKLFVKDESSRFGLNAFKVLGASYAIGRYLAEKLDKDISDISYEELRSVTVRKQLGDITFATATDGNHGRAVAWAAKQLKQKAVVYMPKGSDPVRLKNIQDLGAQASITDLNYDDAVRLAEKKAKENNWVVVQDTAWAGYEAIPTWIMQGYATLAVEALEQLQKQGIAQPTHVFLQAGVGSFAGGVLGFFASRLGKKMPKITIVEPEKANCIYKSAQIGDGKAHNVSGELDTLMAGLACGEPNTISWELLRDYAAAYASCPDYLAATGMRVLATPLKGDDVLISGESGAVTTGLLHLLMESTTGNPARLRKQLGLGKTSVVLLISTEGNTSPRAFRDAVWYGKYDYKNESRDKKQED